MKRKESEYIPVSGPPSQIPLASPEKSSTTLRGHTACTSDGSLQDTVEEREVSTRAMSWTDWLRVKEEFHPLLNWEKHLKTALPSFRGGVRVPVSAETRLWFLHHGGQPCVSACSSHVLQAVTSWHFVLLWAPVTDYSEYKPRKKRKIVNTEKSHGPPLSSIRSF